MKTKRPKETKIRSKWGHAVVVANQEAGWLHLDIKNAIDKWGASGRMTPLDRRCLAAGIRVQARSLIRLANKIGA